MRGNCPRLSESPSSASGLIKRFTPSISLGTLKSMISPAGHAVSRMYVSTWADALAASGPLRRSAKPAPPEVQ